ncbi:MAG: hypothetical protein DRP64_12065 [Verrucomicrobia bacterium]|nr:MAG: hypothetical protein DRP64_12065 [Verrucomicrobiota bacterium]
MSEYAHAMGNSMADLAPLWKTFEENPGMNGGQIWDWADQGLLLPLPGLEGTHWTYGGDWGAYGNERVFCMNGIVLPDRSLNGKSHEVKAVYQQVAFSAVADAPGKVRIQNKFATQNLDEFDIEWVLLENGRPIKSGMLELSVSPLSERVENLPFDLPESAPGWSYHVNFDVKLRRAKTWANRDHLIAQSQVALDIPAAQPPEMDLPNGRVLVLQKGNLLSVQAGDVAIDFDRKAAVLSQFSVDGTALLASGGSLSGVELNVNSWLTDDRLVWPGGKIWNELQAGMNRFERQPVSLELVEEGTASCRIQAVADHLVSGKKQGFRHTATYTILNSGTIQVDNLVQKIDLPSDALCFRIGVRLPVGKEFDVAEYAAKGPDENYDARNAAARFGQYTQPAAEMLGKYVRPQECGNRSGLAWMALRNEEGLGLVIVPAEAGDGSVMPCTREEMDGVLHVPELPEPTRWILRYDAAQAILPKPSNISFEGDAAFSYSIRPLQPGQDAAAVALPVVPAELAAPPVLTGKALFSSLPEDWTWISEDAKVTYSSSSQWAIFPDTLLTTQESIFSFHTDEETEPWLVVDLGETEPLVGMEILNRADAQGDRTRNLRVWLSDDQRDWQEVFSAAAPQSRWRVTLDQPVPARYIKIGLLNSNPTFFHLRGVKVYGSEHKK